MRADSRAMAAIELLCVAPAALFLGALFLREVQPLLGTGRLVDWFAQHVVLGLYVCLVALPSAALVMGLTVMLRSWRRDPGFRRRAMRLFATVRGSLACLLVTVSTLVAGGILAVVAMHLISE